MSQLVIGIREWVLAVSVLLIGAVPVAAQDVPFLFSTTTGAQTKSSVRFEYDVGIAERAFQNDIANQPEQRIGVRASRGHLTLVARFGLRDAGSAYQSSQSAEALFSVVERRGGVSLAVGGGVLHEADGVDVLLGRIVAGRNSATTRLYGNVLLQRPLAAERDGVDLLTSVGWSRLIAPGISLGVEAVVQDLEGFWEVNEAEGGARLLAGPSVHVSPLGGRWHFTATGGPMLHSPSSGRASGAVRDLSTDSRSGNYAIRVALSISLSSSQ